MSLKKTTLVIGASENPDRYSNKAIKALIQHQHPVLALGLRIGNVNGVEIATNLNNFKNEPIDTITLYINPKLQVPFYNEFIALNPKRVIFNPGTENEFFESLLNAQGIETEEACTLVLLGTGQY